MYPVNEGGSEAEKKIKVGPWFLGRIFSRVARLQFSTDGDPWVASTALMGRGRSSTGAANLYVVCRSSWT